MCIHYYFYSKNNVIISEKTLDFQYLQRTKFPLLAIVSVGNFSKFQPALITEFFNYSSISYKASQYGLKLAILPKSYKSRAGCNILLYNKSAKIRTFCRGNDYFFFKINCVCENNNFSRNLNIDFRIF